MALTKEKIDLFKRAVDSWGVDSQLDMAVEESAEFIVAIQHLRRNNKPETVENLYEEIADVELMVEQVKFMLDIDSIKLYQIKCKKLERLEELLQG